MASFYLRKNARTKLKVAIKDYDPHSSLTSNSRKISEQSGVCLTTIIQMRTKVQPFALESIAAIFKFLQISEDAEDDNLVYQKSEIIFDAATRSDLEWIASSEKRYFGSNYTKQVAILNDWFDWNKQGFWIFKVGTERIGSLILMPIRPDARRQFQRGDITERDITAADIFLPKEKHLVDAIYIESIMFHTVFDSWLFGAEEKICKLISFILGKSCNVENLIEIYALRASTRGYNLMSNSGFSSCIGQHEKRANGRKMYTIGKDDFLKSVESRRVRLAQVFSERHYR